MGAGVGRLEGVEFYRMGMTNAVGRYPVHFHHCVTGAESMVADCAIHRSFYRAITVHDTFNLTVARNTVYDVAGHAVYLESGVEEHNRIEHNLVAHVHAINGVVIMNGFHHELPQTDDCVVPADHTASGFYISNAHNYVVGNAASGGWAGLQFPTLPDPIDPALRHNGVVPKDRPALLIAGNSVHSSSWFATQSGSVYAGGSLYYAEDDVGSTQLRYNPARVGTLRLTRSTQNDAGDDVWFTVWNTTAWLVGVGATGWGRRSEYRGFEVHDFVNKAIFVLFDVWLDAIVMNCRTSNAPRIPDPATGSNEVKLSDGTHFSGFFTYDHLMKHLLTNWRISNCGGAARGLAPYVDGGVVETGTDTSALFTMPINGFGPEVQLISTGMEFDWESMGGEAMANSSLFFSGAGADTYHSMSYQSNWIDADGSMTRRGVETVLGPARAGKWWALDDRPGKCELQEQWKFQMLTCDMDTRHLGHLWTKVMPSSDYPVTGAGSQAFRSERSGTMTHFGLRGDVSGCVPPEVCNDTTTRSWDPDLTGPYNHGQLGGWYLSWDGGTPRHLDLQRVQQDPDTTLVLATSVPAGTVLGDLSVFAESYTRTYNYTAASSLAEVRASIDRFWLDTAADTLYWRVIPGYVAQDGTFDWIGRDSTGANSVGSIADFTRGGVTLRDTTTPNQFRLHIYVDCAADGQTGHFCAEAPAFQVPEMGCPDGEEMVAIDACAGPVVATSQPTSQPTGSPATSAPTPNTPDTPEPTSVVPPPSSPAGPPTVPPTSSPSVSELQGGTGGSSGSSGDGASEASAVIGAVVGAVLLLLLIGVVVALRRRRVVAAGSDRRHSTQMPATSNPTYGGFEIRRVRGSAHGPGETGLAHDEQQQNVTTPLQ